MSDLIEPPAWTLPSPPGHKETAITVGRAISDAISDFAQHRGLDAIIRHHDEPIWYVSQNTSMSDGWVRSTHVQIATLTGTNGFRIEANPSARMVNENIGVARVMIRRPPPADVEISRDDDFASLRRKLEKLLEATWRSAKALEPLENENFRQESLPGMT
jgi:hypothetical protein